MVIINYPQISNIGGPQIKNAIWGNKIRTPPPKKTLLVFLSVVYNKNFSIKYIHLKSHFLRKSRYEVYN